MLFKEVMIKLKNSECFTYANVLYYDFPVIPVHLYEGRYIRLKVFKLHFLDSSLDKTFSLGSIKCVKVKNGLFFHNIEVPKY